MLYPTPLVRAVDSATKRASFNLRLVLALGLICALSHALGEQVWHQEKGFRWTELRVPSGGHTGFQILSPPETGIAFTNTLDLRTAEANRVLFNGSGLAVGDYDQDGLPDIYFCSLNGRNALYKNHGGWKFKDVTRESGIVCSNQFCRGAVFADLNGDGWLDLLVATTGDGVLCFTNQRNGTFLDVTRTAGTASKYGSETLALADVDGNGTLDLYVANNRTSDVRDQGQVDLRMVNGKLSVPPALQDRFVIMGGKFFEYGEPDSLYLNDGSGHFAPVSWTQGAFVDETGQALTNAPLDWGLTASFRDINGDGYPDLYVCNDYWTPDRIWINDGRGHFRAIDQLAFRETSASSMGVDFADLNRCGNLDVFVVDMLSRQLPQRKCQMLAQSSASPVGVIDNRPQISRNTLFRNRGDGTFAEIANFAGVSASDWSWSPLFVDVDLDGYEDVLIPAGHLKDTQDLDAEARIRARAAEQKRISRIADPKERLEAFIQAKMENSHFYPSLESPIIAYHNLGEYRFEETTLAWGTAQPGVHHAMAFADFDGDGDLDLVVNNLGTAAGIYRNETSAPRVAVRLLGLPPNTQGIGARIKFLGGTVPNQSLEIIAGGRYMAGADTLAVFAPGTNREGMGIEVRWRTGKLSVINGVVANRLYEIDEAGAVTADVSAPVVGPPLFEDVSSRIGHAHHENEYNDFERQSLLPHKLSQLGPAVAWVDIDRDGWEDLIVGTGKGGRLAVLLNDKHGGFKSIADSELVQPAGSDQAGILGWHEPSGASFLLTALANYEEVSSISSSVAEFDFAEKKLVETLPFPASSAGPLAMADIDGEGHLTLFVGGRVVPGRYPEPASCRLFRRVDRKWQIDEANTRAVEKAGMVSGALWSDLDGDGYPELILACEWGPIRVWGNRKGSLREITTELGLDKYLGWWNGIATLDLDGSGHLAIVASNWGLNTPYQAASEYPALLYYGDFADRGTVELIEAHYDPYLQAVAPLRRRDQLATALPDLPLRFPTQKDFCHSSLPSVLGPKHASAAFLQANTLASTIFRNRTNLFEPQPLPAEAQYAPAFAVSVADFDGDGFEDLFLGQNFFPNQPEVPRCDAGRGLMLRGDGTGRLSPVPGQSSGIKIYGEQRGAAVADFDHDGRVDLVVAQNGAATRLFRNIHARPGLRVRLAGPPGNPDGIGAQLRLVFAGHQGPVREIHAGSGYWSQDSVVTVLSMPETPSRIWIRWPGGKATITELPPNVGEISVDFTGKVVASNK